MTDIGQRVRRLSPAARRLLAEKLRAGKEQQRNHSAAPGVLALFGEWVRRTPGATAVADARRALSYAELDARAAALARRLLAAGAGAGRPVAFCLQRSIESVVVMLAALKCGAAYVPLDPAHPPARRAFVLRDTAAAVLVVGRDVDVAALGYAGPVLDAGFLDADEPGIGETPGLPEPEADALAYVMYTSGSTGTPKGVCIAQRGITRLVWRSDYIEFRPADRVAHASNPAFDAATFEVWGALLNGARLEILPTDSLLSARALGESIRQRELSVLFLTTALFNQLALEAPEMFCSLRCLAFGGEAASLAAVRAVVARGKPAQLINGYGPTRTPRSPRATRRARRCSRRTGARCRSAGRSAAATCACSMRKDSRSRPARRASSTPAARAWRAATSTAPISTASPSCPIRWPTVRGSTAPATWCGCAKTACSSTSGAPTTR